MGVVSKKSKETKCGLISVNYWHNLKRYAARKNLEFDCSIEYAWELFLKQNCRCALTGKELGFCPKQTASLDRINNNYGYIVGNLWWVHKKINRLKSDFSLNELIYLCNKISNHKIIDIKRQEKWDRRFIYLAKHVASWSKDPSTQVGAVIFDRFNRIISTGYNGFPKDIKDDINLLNNRDAKYKMVVHAEVNAILFSNRDLNNCSLATWPFMPCSNCAKAIIQTGIRRIVAPYSDNPRWKDDFDLSKSMFIEAGIELTLFRDFN